MTIPAGILDIFATVMLLVAAVSAGQLAVARRWRRGGVADADITVSHLLMGIAMAGMLAAGLRTLPGAAWEVIFAVMTAWFAWRLWPEAKGRGVGALARGHHAPHLVHSAAMLYMFAALAAPVAGGSGMAGAGGSSGGTQTLRLPTLAFVFVLLLVGYTVRDLDRQALADGYFHVVAGGLAPAGLAGPAGPMLATASPAPATGPASGAPAWQGADGAAAVAAVAQAQATQAAEASPAGRTTEGRGEAGLGAAGRLLLAPAVVKGCRVAMGVTMALMLIIMI
jgi:hypothetical protein